MANKRMFSLDVVDTDHFCDMPISARLLYYELGMRGDDEGFVQNPKKIMLSTGTTRDDLTILAAKGYVILFASGVLVITHWQQNNTLKNDRFHETKCLAEKAQIQTTPAKTYVLSSACIQSGSNMVPQHNPAEPNKTEQNLVNSSFSEGGAGGEGIKKAAAKGLRKEAEERARKRRDNPSEAETQEALEDVKHAKELAALYDMPKSKATRSALLDDVDRVGWEAVEKGLKDAAYSNSRDGLSINFYRTVLKNGTKEEAEWNQARDLLAKYFTLYGDERDNKNIQMVLDEAKNHDWYFAERFIRRIHESRKSASNGS